MSNVPGLITSETTGQPVVIIGAGLAGFACARRLTEANVPVLVLEAQDQVGGRVRTDRMDGFLLDRGFQVFLTACPCGRRRATIILHGPAAELRQVIWKTSD